MCYYLLVSFDDLRLVSFGKPKTSMMVVTVLITGTKPQSTYTESSSNNYILD